MSSTDFVSEFLKQYQQDRVYLNKSAVPQLGQPPSSWIQERQRATLDSADGHVIPLDDYEFRIHGKDDQHESNPDYVRADNVLHRIERTWDRVIEKYGLCGISTYLPFHVDDDTYGIYIRKQGVRFLGHLLYHWSRVGNIHDTEEEATKFLFEYDRKGSDRLLQAEPTFKSKNDAFDLALEILVRHQWFHHQVELLTGYIEDSTKSLYYPDYHDAHLSTDEITSSLEEVVADSYVARSQACHNKSPDGLFVPLLNRTLGTRRSSPGNFKDFADRSFDEGCFEISRDIMASSSNGSQSGVELARQLAFETDIPRSVPDRIAIYVTRSEPDPDNASYARGVSLDKAYSVSFSDEWEKEYGGIRDENLKNKIDTVIEKAKKVPPSIDKKGKGVGPKNVYYGDIDGKRRFVYRLNEEDGQVKFLGFGDHDKPADHLLRKY